MSTGPSNGVKLVLGIICLCLLGGILTVGLWPFHAPRNEVEWLSNENGLLFGEYGSILSSAPFLNAEKPTPCSIEIWIEPGETFDANDLISFYTPDNPMQFRIEQSGDDVFVSKDLRDEPHRIRNQHIAVDHVFRSGVKILITVTSGEQGTSVFTNGMLAKTFPRFLLTTENLTGVLIVGNSPIRNYSWAGHMRGMAFFGTELTAVQAMQHYQIWRRNEAPPVLSSENPIALYSFGERQGEVVHNQVTSQPNLFIPSHYFVLHQVRLVAPWNEFHEDWSYLKDVLINIGGFVPLGLFFCAFLSRSKATNRPVLVTILVGGMTSFIIEFTQSFLPTRDSGITDLMTNTMGTALGAMLYRLPAAEFLFMKLETLINALIQV